MTSSKLNRKLYTDNLKEDIKSVVKAEHEFEN